MKALDIIKAMSHDSTLAEYSQVSQFDPDLHVEGLEVEAWIAGLFGDFRLKAGRIERGTYLSVWQVDLDRVSPFGELNAPDVILERNRPEVYEKDDREVWLWRIE